MILAQISPRLGPRECCVRVAVGPDGSAWARAGSARGTGLPL